MVSSTKDSAISSDEISPADEIIQESSSLALIDLAIFLEALSRADLSTPLIAIQ